MAGSTQNSIACIVRGNEILLYRRINTAYELNKLGLVGGKIEPGETPVKAMIREIKEETSLRVSETNLKLLTSLPIKHADKNYLTHVFLVKEWNGEIQNLEPDKCGGLHWHPTNNLPDDVIPVVHDIVALVPPQS